MEPEAAFRLIDEVEAPKQQRAKSAVARRREEMGQKEKSKLEEETARKRRAERG